jgi:N-acetylglucosamine kinase-like BadF-type ATPase
MGNLLAVDAGGTTTRAIVLDRTGACRGFGVSGSGNPISSGPEHVARQVAAATEAALLQSGASGVDGTTVLAMAGSRTHASPDWIAPELRRIGVSGPVVLESDLLATFCSGAWEPDGYALVAGTGAAAIRVRGGRQDGTADGIGWLLGDTGSGFWIGRRVARAVAAQLDGRGPTTTLTGLLLEMLEIPTGDAGDPESAAHGRPDALRRLLDAVYTQRPIDLARFAPLAFAAGDDAVATAIAADAAAALRTSLGAIHLDAVRGPLVCGGGVLTTLAVPTDGFTGVTAVRHVTDGAVGAAVLALRDDGVHVDRAIFERVAETLGSLRA